MIFFLLHILRVRLIDSFNKKALIISNLVYLQLPQFLIDCASSILYVHTVYESHKSSKIFSFSFQFFCEVGTLCSSHRVSFWYNFPWQWRDRDFFLIHFPFTVEGQGFFFPYFCSWFRVSFLLHFFADSGFPFWYIFSVVEGFLFAPFLLLL